MPGYETFIGKLIAGGNPTATAAEFDALLQWLAGRRNQAADMMENAFRIHAIPTNEARRCILRYLDACLFCHGNDYYRLLGVRSDSSFSTIRERRKQLLQIFHPDRHSSDRPWFTERTEQLNRAYGYLKKSHGRSDSGHAAAPAKPAPTMARRSRPQPSRKGSSWRSVIANKNKIRQTLKVHLGTPEQFERRFYVVLFLAPAIALLITYINHTRIMEHRALLTPVEGEDAARSAAVTEKGFEVRDRPGYSKNVDTGSATVVVPEGLAGREPSELDLPSLMDNSTDQGIGFPHWGGSEKSGIEGVNDDTKTLESKSDTGITEKAAGVRASKGPGSNSRNAEDNHSEDGVLVPALKKQHGVALSYIRVAVAADTDRPLPMMQSPRPLRQRASKGVDTDFQLDSSSDCSTPRVSLSAAPNVVQQDVDDRRYDYDKHASPGLRQCGPDQSDNTSGNSLSAYAESMVK